MNVPETVGVPLIVTRPPDTDAETPAGKPVTVAPVAVAPYWYTMLEIAVLIQTDWLVEPEFSTKVLLALTVMVPLIGVRLHIPEAVMV